MATLDNPNGDTVASSYSAGSCEINPLEPNNVGKDGSISGDAGGGGVGVRRTILIAKYINTLMLFCQL